MLDEKIHIKIKLIKFHVYKYFVNLRNIKSLNSSIIFFVHCFAGRVWSIVFPEQDTYIYGNGDGTRNVVTVLRRVQNGRRYLGIDFWYSHYYLVGRYGIPDFYKLEVRR